MGLLSFIVLILQRNFYIPDVTSLFWLVLVGLFGLVAQVSLTQAYQMAPASLISCYSYLQIVFCTLLGILLFREFPDLFTMFGIFLIFFGGYLNYKTKYISN